MGSNQLEGIHDIEFMKSMSDFPMFGRGKTATLSKLPLFMGMAGEMIRHTGVSPKPITPTGKNRRKEKAQVQRKLKNKAAAASRKKNRRG